MVTCAGPLSSSSDRILSTNDWSVGSVPFTAALMVEAASFTALAAAVVCKKKKEKKKKRAEGGGGGVACGEFRCAARAHEQGRALGVGVCT